MSWNGWIAKSGPKPSFLPFLCETELSLKSRAHFADLIFQKGSETDSFLTCSSGNRALPTLSCTFCRPNLPKVLRHQQFLTIFKWKSSSRYSRANFADLIFQNCSDTDSFYSSVRFLSATFPDRAAKPRKQRPSFRDHGSHFTQKNTWFCARGCFQAWNHAFPISFTSQLFDDDNVVAMMVRKLAMTIVRNCWKFPN